MRSYRCFGASLIDFEHYPAEKNATGCVLVA
jgi:hypothetical protein